MTISIITITTGFRIRGFGEISNTPTVLLHHHHFYNKSRFVTDRPSDWLPYLDQFPFNFFLAFFSFSLIVLMARFFLSGCSYLSFLNSSPLLSPFPPFSVFSLHSLSCDPLHLPTLFVRVCIGCIIITIILVALCSMPEPCISIWLAC